MSDAWYESAIEPGIRKQVRLLRDHGFNTYSSCEHRMQVACEGVIDVNFLTSLLHDRGYSEFTITTHRAFYGGRATDDTLIQFGTDLGKRPLGGFYALAEQWAVPIPIGE